MPSTMGMNTSGPRVEWPNANKSSPATKVLSNSAHGASMDLHPGGKEMYVKDWAKGGTMQAHPSPSFPAGETARPKAIGSGAPSSASGGTSTAKATGA